MTNNELNQFILHYLVEDKTHSAIMLTGAWGTGKSYYIQNELVPFLKEEHKKDCVMVSLYGIKSTAEISRSIYIELRAKTLSAKGEAAVAGKLIAKTIVRGVVSRFEIDFSKENDTMQELYESINLSNKLVISPIIWLRTRSGPLWWEERIGCSATASRAPNPVPLCIRWWKRPRPTALSLMGIYCWC